MNIMLGMDGIVLLLEMIDSGLDKLRPIEVMSDSQDCEWDLLHEAKVQLTLAYWDGMDPNITRNKLMRRGDKE